MSSPQDAEASRAFALHTEARRGLDEPGFFTPPQRRTIAAAMARIIPTDATPGAAEAATIDFVDRYLSGTGFIYARPDGSGFEVLAGRSEQAWQSRIDVMRRKYLEGIHELDSRSQGLYRNDFADLEAAQQDEVLRAIERQEGMPDSTLSPAYALGGPSASGPALQQTSTEVDLDFFPLLVAHTRQGFYADPIYGGNRGRVGWEVIGFPGPASLAEVHSGRYSTLDWFAEGHTDPSHEKREAHHGVQGQSS